MKKLFGLFFLLVFVVLAFSSCERKCVCKNLESGDESIYYGAYSRKECTEAEDYYNALYNKDIFDCTYK